MTVLVVQAIVVLPAPSAETYLQRSQVPENLDAPYQLLIPTIDFPIPLTAGAIVDGEWQISPTSVAYLPRTTPDQGLVLYGHNWSSLLASLPQLKQGQSIEVQYGNRTEVYTVETSFVVSAQDTSIVELAKPGYLVIYTCAGWLDSKRHVVLARL